MQLKVGNKTKGFERIVDYDPEGWNIGFEGAMGQGNLKDELKEASPHYNNILHPSKIKSIPPVMLEKWKKLPNDVKNYYKKIKYLPYHALNLAMVKYERRAWSENQARRRREECNRSSLLKQAYTQRLANEMARYQKADDYSTIVKPNGRAEQAGKAVVVRETVLMSNAEPTTIRDKFVSDPFKKSLKRTNQHPLLAVNKPKQSIENLIDTDEWGASMSPSEKNRREFTYTDAANWGNDIIRESDVKVHEDSVEAPSVEAQSTVELIAPAEKVKKEVQKQVIIMVHPLAMNMQRYVPQAAASAAIQPNAQVQKQMPAQSMATQKGLPFLTQVKQWFQNFLEIKPKKTVAASQAQMKKQIALKEQAKKDLNEIAKALPNSKAIGLQKKNGIDPKKAHSELLNQNIIRQEQEKASLISPTSSKEVPVMHKKIAEVQNYQTSTKPLESKAVIMTQNKLKMLPQVR